jgi:alpha-galactosidase
MPSCKNHPTYRFGPTVVDYVFDSNGAQVALAIRPVKASLPKVQKQKFIDDISIRAYARANRKRYPASCLSPLVHLDIEGDPFPGGLGRSLVNGHATGELRFQKQHTRTRKECTCIETTLASPRGVEVVHTLTHRHGSKALGVSCRIRNMGDKPITLRSFSAFCLSEITPYARDDAAGRLHLHELRTRWSSEGRHITTPFEELLLEPSWTGFGVRHHRIGQVGSMPANGNIPWLAVQDAAAGVLWGAVLNAPGSWQMEVHRHGDNVSLIGSGGSYEYSHWCKCLEPGCEYTAPAATIACVHGGFHELTAALLSKVSAHRTNKKGGAEDSAVRPFPVIFNEWGTTWGTPSERKLGRLVPAARALGVDTFVIDAGWYADGQGRWADSHGDWVPSADLFPSGLERAAGMISDHGMTPGIWFEAETCGFQSQLFKRGDLLLQSGGKVHQVGSRAFLDMENPAARDHLDQRLKRILLECGFRYLKVDYNESIGGAGLDGGNSSGEKLERCLNASLDYFQKLRDDVPGLVMENCSAGGHRLSPPWIEAFDLTSFSDVHECLEIPIIAANLQAVLRPAKNLIWCCLRPDDSEDRINYGLCAAMMGRLCLSGDIDHISESQREQVRCGVNFYHRCADILHGDHWQRHGQPTTGRSYRHPSGWQSVVRFSEKAGRALVITHTFALDNSETIRIPLPASGQWQLDAHFGNGRPKLRRKRAACSFEPGMDSAWQAQAVILKRKTI